MQKMKTILKKMIAIMLFFSLYSCSNSQIHVKSSFLLPNLNHFLISAKIIKTSDNNVIVAGTSGMAMSRYYIIYKLKQNGEQIWKQKYKINEVTEIQSVIELKDKNFIIAGFGDIGAGTGGSDIFIKKLNEKGEIIWEKSYNFEFITSFSKMIITNDNNILIVGSTNIKDVKTSDVLVAKIDFEGNIIWQKSFGNIYHEIGEDIIEIENNYFVLANYFDNNLITGKIQLMKLDKNGKIIWSKFIGNKRGYSVCDITKTVDNCFVITGWKNGSSYEQMSFFLIKIDKEGKILWKKTYTKNEREMGFYVFSLKKDYLIFGIDRNEKNTKIDIIKTNKRGVKIDEFEISEKNNSIGITDVIQTGNNEFYIFSSIRKDNKNYGKVFIIKVE